MVMSGPSLRLRVMSRSMILLQPSGLCYLLRLRSCLWSVLQPKAMLMFEGLAKTLSLTGYCRVAQAGSAGEVGVGDLALPSPGQWESWP